MARGRMIPSLGSRISTSCAAAVLPASTPWPTACSARSPSSRACPSCSSGSPPTSATSCAPPLTTCRWPPTSSRVARGLPAARGPLGRAAARGARPFERLLSDLLEISRYDAGPPRPRLGAPTSGPRRAGYGRHSALADAHGCETAGDRPPDPVVAEVDARRVERILRNLVGNAIEHGQRHAVRGHPGGQPTGGRGHRPRPRCRCLARPSTSSTGSGGPTPRGCAPSAAAARLSISLEDARLHGGWLQVWGQPGSVRSSVSPSRWRRPVPDQFPAAAAPDDRRGRRVRR
jgi:two-component system sensor histidine kinase MtrB